MLQNYYTAGIVIETKYKRITLHRTLMKLSLFGPIKYEKIRNELGRQAEILFGFLLVAEAIRQHMSGGIVFAYRRCCSKTGA